MSGTIITDVFCYNPTAPVGKRFTVFAWTPNRRYYHSVAALLPDGRTFVSGIVSSLLSNI